MTELRDRIQTVVSEEPVALFMKGTPGFIMCGNCDRAEHPARPTHPPGAVGHLRLADGPAGLHRRRAGRRRRHRRGARGQRRVGAEARGGARPGLPAAAARRARRRRARRLTFSTVSLEEARRIAVRAQLLDGSATSVRDTVRKLGFLQMDPISTVATPQELVLWSRHGPYDRSELDRL